MESDQAGVSLEGQVLAGRYRVVKLANPGANSVIADAIDIEADRPVTVKIVLPEYAADEEFLRKFRRLAELSMALTHPNIASVLDWGEVEYEGEPTVFWTVEALGGGSMRDLLDRGRMLAPGQALVVGLEACRALDAAHQKGLFHTELTPSKMVFGADRRLRVIDFGMARLLGEAAWSDMANVPTHVARYASPEQALGVPVDAKTDVYALSLILIESVTGSVPFDGDSTQSTLANRIDKLLPVSADLGSLASVLERAGRPESADRFTAAEFGRALVQAAGKLAKPEPIPIIATGLFDTTTMRRPSDPTGGVERPPEPAPVGGSDQADEAIGEEDIADETGLDAASVVGAAAIVAGAAGTAAVVAAAGSAASEVGTASSAAAVGALDGGEASTEEASTSDADTGDASTGDASAGETSAAAASSDPADRVGPAGGDDVAAAASTDAVNDADEAEVAESVGVADIGEDAGVAGAATGGGGDDLRLIDDPGPNGTEQMPATVVEAARSATTPTAALGITAADAAVLASGPELFEDPDFVESRDGTGEIYDDQRRTRRKGPIALLILLLLAGLGGLAYAGSLLLETKSFEVPVLAGSAEGPARNQIEGNDWTILVERERSDTFPEPGTVIRTDPGPGTELDEGESITLVLSDGFEFRSLPDVSNLTAEAARAQLEALMLVVSEAPEREFSEELADGVVVSWQVVGNATLQAGANVLPGDGVQLTLSKGPAPRDVPDVAGLTLEEATSRLDELQLVITTGDELFSEDVEIGRIVAQSPAVGEQIERGATVSVQASKGPDFIALPDLDGLAYRDAEELLLSLGFEIGTLLGTTDGTFVQLTIDGVEVEIGTEFRRGQVVDVIFL